MESRSKILGHAAHPMLIPFPLGLLTAGAVFDGIHALTGTARWAEVSFFMIAAGLVGGLLAAPFGTRDWAHIPKATRARTIGAMHGIGNVLVMVLFGLSLLLRRADIADPSAVALVLSWAGAALGGITGWMGGELVERLGVGVDDGANVDAPSSLSHPAA